jgi:hypothetical protein
MLRATALPPASPDELLEALGHLAVGVRAGRVPADHLRRPIYEIVGALQESGMTAEWSRRLVRQALESGGLHHGPGGTEVASRTVMLALAWCDEASSRSGSATG